MGFTTSTGARLGVWTLGLLLSMPALAGRADRAPKVKKIKAEVYEGVTTDQLAGLLDRSGVFFESSAQPGQHTVFRFEQAGYRMALIMADYGTGRANDVYLYAGFSMGHSPSLERINEWNRGARFSRAYIDVNGDPVLESDLDFERGTTAESFLFFVELFGASVHQFSSHIGFSMTE